jgi:hypothetical protein
LIHGEKIGFGSSPEVAASYLAVAAILYFCARRASFAPLAAHHAPPLAERAGRRPPDHGPSNRHRHPGQDVSIAVFATVKFSAMRRKWRLLQS